MALSLVRSVWIIETAKQIPANQGEEKTLVLDKETHWENLLVALLECLFTGTHRRERTRGRPNNTQRREIETEMNYVGRTWREL